MDAFEKVVFVYSLSYLQFDLIWVFNVMGNVFESDSQNKKTVFRYNIRVFILGKSDNNQII